ncbi:MAG: c-type cytochrome [Pseudohongiellaceae bacterium]
MSSARTPKLHLGLYFTALLVSLSTPAAVAQDEGNLFNTTVDVNLGGRYFQRQCSRCHGQDAKGNDETGAPDLTGRLSRASTDTGIFMILREGISGTAMLPVPAETPDTTVWQLVAYINSLRTDPANIELPGSIANGESLFFGKGVCSACHMVNGIGGRQGPDLSRAGQRLSPEQLQSALLDPDEEVLPRWWTMRVTDADGTVREGLRMDEDSFSLRIIDSEENLWSFRKDRMAAVERIETSTMPGYRQSLTAGEIDDLVAYLYSLRQNN